MSSFNRRHLLAGSGAMAAAAAASTALAQAAAPKSLAGKTFLVTGTSSGFGKLGALHYARLGARVFATMRGVPRPESQELQDLASSERLKLEVLQLDVLSENEVNAAVEEAERRNGGPLDVLVNNAGVVIGGPVEVHDMEATRLAFDTNVFGYHRTARAVLPGMRRKRSGLIVNVSSQVGRVISPGLGLYSATKFAVESMSEQLAYEVAQHGVEVTIIQPGGYATKAGVNGNRYAGALARRAATRHAGGYPEMVEAMGARMAGGGGAAASSAGAPDPMDVPRAIAEIAALPAGQRPLRRPVHPGPKPQLAINKVCAETQLALLEKGPFGPAAKMVLE